MKFGNDFNSIRAQRYEMKKQRALLRSRGADNTNTLMATDVPDEAPQHFLSE